MPIDAGDDPAAHEQSLPGNRRTAEDHRFIECVAAAEMCGIEQDVGMGEQHHEAVERLPGKKPHAYREDRVGARPALAKSVLPGRLWAVQNDDPASGVL